jgi:hypothetical protein
MQKNDKFLAFPFYSTGGMINLLMELEIRVGLALLSGRTLVSPNKYPISPMDEDHLYGRYREAGLLDLYDLPVRHISLTKLYKRGFDSLYSLGWQGNCASEAYFSQLEPNHFTRQDLDQFRMKRQYEWKFPDNDADVWGCGVQRTFANYSYFFLVQPEKRKRFLSNMAKIQPKVEYLNLAQKITKEIAEYNAIHVRRGDFKSWWVKTATPESVLSTISGFMSADKPLVICTDNSQEGMFFSPIAKAYPKSLLLDEHIEREYQSEIAALPYSDASVVALLSILVAANAKEFAGTPFSTFTSAIHRRRMQRQKGQQQRFIHNPFDPVLTPMKEGVFLETKAGPFSWNRLNLQLPETANALAWFREWPEAVS